MRIPVLASFSLVALAACGVEPLPVDGGADPAGQARTDDSFLDEIITTYGRNGESCYASGREVLCVTASAKYERPLKIGDPIPEPEDLSLCARVSDGTLNPSTCKPVDADATEHCHAEIPGECEWLAAVCEIFGGQGSCGDCKEGDCCCTVED